MMSDLIVLAVVVLLVSAALLAIHTRHTLKQGTEDVDPLLALAFRILPVSGTVHDERALMDTIGGCDGVRQMRRYIRIIGCIAASMKRTDPAGVPEAEGLLLRSWWGMVIGWLAQMEMWAKTGPLPIAPILCTETLARLYVDMAVSVDAIESMRMYA